MSLTEEAFVSDAEPFVDVEGRRCRDIGEVPAVEVINTVAVHLMSAAAVKCGLAEGRMRRPRSTWTRRAS